jgi:murein DD-endopeptidase MepM/ murein hydrolase activator NlpD
MAPEGRIMDRHEDEKRLDTRIEISEFASRAPDEPRRRRVRETVDMAFAPEREQPKAEPAAEEPAKPPEPKQRKAAFSRIKRFRLDPASKRLLQRSAVCGVLLALALTVKLVDTPFTNDVAGGIHDALTFEMSIDDAIGKLKFVENEAANLAKVFAPAEEFSLDRPVAGKIVEDFEALGHPYIAITAEDKEFVFVCANGTVKETGTHAELGKYVVVQHADGKATTYYGLGQVTATKGREMRRGDSLGTMAGESPRLCLKLTASSHPVDPAPYLD